MNASKQVALVTGSSRGIGAEIARRLARDGFRVVVNYAGGAGPAREVVDAIAANGGEAIAVQADIADPAAVAALFDAAEQAFGHIDVVVNSAGVMKLGAIADYDDTTFDQTVAINLKGTFNVSREAAKRVRHGGRIVNLSSTMVGVRLPTYGVYVATKAAVEGLTQVLAQEMRGRGISVNAVAPGPVATELFLEGKSPEQVDRLAKMNPLERLGQPADIAGVVAFLAGPDGAWVNGQILRANGGMC
ncbi:short chain dehydrogenase family protein [Burkholderia ambifaria AMMD]|uniref:Short-chain dehydrogenase/reductase SDR n=1 Tax=Burkholderia ambifaria (strain ATCC BAA-244 / DSM 16087 / CCUG 44356 / LMG 19182 / AMMD) TaxID=339670 RepID=Q0BCN9_BURCM|nr:SDR family oxidoreductase [Burkholderia ambifaria]ABI88084.1 short-chain dehydrogenase/reductase SDR [Burkholderia ambifaria AMMD]AJY20679.1 short chain dehydrogenase family protein [Burkholderia ambifaria AMMD]MBR7932829.1 SDR family oxidoreductase [Burkholderia ambifaria]PEH64757.1 3-ketoacyl-ACP reductase [Burkholderia ambifaria]QQC04725.1 SDR family oxidoreductase [Burkholderia ambifaria]